MPDTAKRTACQFRGGEIIDLLLPKGGGRHGVAWRPPGAGGLRPATNARPLEMIEAAEEWRPVRVVWPDFPAAGCIAEPNPSIHEVRPAMRSRKREARWPAPSRCREALDRGRIGAPETDR